MRSLRVRYAWARARGDPRVPIRNGSAISAVSEITLDAAKWLGAKAETDPTALKRKVIFNTNFIFK
jgi:hypothetical protein